MIYCLIDFNRENILTKKKLCNYQSRNSIRFSNSGSRYNPYNRCFMKNFKNLYNVEIDKEQINIEEYMYLKKVKKL